MTVTDVHTRTTDLRATALKWLANLEQATNATPPRTLGAPSPRFSRPMGSGVI